MAEDLVRKMNNFNTFLSVIESIGMNKMNDYEIYLNDNIIPLQLQAPEDYNKYYSCFVLSATLDNINKTGKIRIYNYDK